MIRAVLLLLCVNTYLVQGFLLKATSWNDLKVTWGLNPFGSHNFVSLPTTEQEAVRQGWRKEKDCSQMNGIRYIEQNGDRATMLVFNKTGAIAGISTAIPKGLPFNFPSTKVQALMRDEGDFFSITAYFVDPNYVCTEDKTSSATGDRLIIAGQSMTLPIPLDQNQQGHPWTMGKCFVTMGQHYWMTMSGAQVDESTKPDDFAPYFLLYNAGKLNGFGWAFNANLDSKRYEHPKTSVLNKFIDKVPNYLYNPATSAGLSTMHIFLDNTPELNFC